MENRNNTREWNDLKNMFSDSFQLFKKAPTGYFLYDMKYHLLSANEYFMNCFHLDETELTNFLITDLIDLSSREDFIQHTKNVVQLQEAEKATQSQGCHCKVTFETPKGKLPVKVLSNVAEGDQTVIRSIFINMAEEEKVGEELKAVITQSEKVREEKMGLLANISHEVRTSLNGITGFLQLLELSHTDTEQRNYIKNIKTSTDVLLSVINDILDVSKMEAGEMKLDHTPFQLRKELEDAVALFAAKAAEKGIDLNLLVHSDIPQVVVGDPFRIKQLMINLISNAIKFTDNGYVFLEVKKGAQQKDVHEIEFSVKDTGIGILEGDEAVIFQPFSQADSTDSRKKYGGSGLGLAICKTIVELMGGKIYVESQPDRGTVFSVDLPMQVYSDINHQSDWNHDLEINKKILIADPNSLSRKVISTYLEEAGCTVIQVASMVEETCLKNCTGYPYDLLVIDKEHYHELKKIGIQPERFLGADPDGEPVPVIFCSSFAYGIKQNPLGDNFFYRDLYKPYRRNVLVDFLLEAFQDHKNPQGIAKNMGQGSQFYRFDLSHMKALVVEDNAASRNFLMRLLESRGVPADCAANGEEAVHAFRSGSYDLILMDCQMPVMNGFDAARQIRAEELAGRHVHMVALTGNVMQEDIKQCYRAGMDEYLCKPVDIGRIDKILERVHQKSIRYTFSD